MSNDDEDYKQVVADLYLLTERIHVLSPLSPFTVSQCLRFLCAVSKMLVEKCRNQDKKIEMLLSSMETVSRGRSGSAVVLDDVPVRSSLRNAGDKVELWRRGSSRTTGRRARILSLPSQGS